MNNRYDAHLCADHGNFARIRERSIRLLLQVDVHGEVLSLFGKCRVIGEETWALWVCSEEELFLLSLSSCGASSNQPKSRGMTKRMMHVRLTK